MFRVRPDRGVIQLPESRQCQELQHLDQELLRGILQQGETCEVGEDTRARPWRVRKRDLFELYQAGEITYEDAIAHADSPNDLRLMIKLGSEADADHLDGATRNLRLQD